MTNICLSPMFVSWPTINKINNYLLSHYQLSLSNLTFEKYQLKKKCVFIGINLAGKPFSHNCMLRILHKLDNKNKKFTHVAECPNPESNGCNIKRVCDEINHIPKITGIFLKIENLNILFEFIFEISDFSYM